MNSYSIDFDPRTRVLELRIGGFWNEDAMARFGVEIVAKRNALLATGKRFGFLCDGAEFAVQSQGVTQMLTRLVDAENRVNRMPVALLAESALVRMQLGRVMAAPHVRVFAEREDATTWLAERIAAPS